jgi:uncharacterized protein (TIGR00255 family)
MRSMTGFGRSEQAYAGWRILAEMKSVNQRYCDIQMRLPNGWWFFEPWVKKTIQAQVERGRIEVVVSLITFAQNQAAGKINTQSAANYLRQMHADPRVAKRIAPPTWESLINLPGVIQTSAPSLPMKELQPKVEAAVEKALEQMVRMREREGKRLAADFGKRLADLNKAVGQLAISARRAKVAQERKVRAQCRSYLGRLGMGNVAEGMIAEVMARGIHNDVTEELVRVHSHGEEMARGMEQKGSCGRRWDFLIQEMHREMNTVGAKSGDLAMTRWVLTAKEILEKMREQMQNIE